MVRRPSNGKHSRAPRESVSKRSRRLRLNTSTVKSRRGLMKKYHFDVTSSPDAKTLLVWLHSKM